MDRKMSQTEFDFNHAKENCEKMSLSLMKKYRWIRGARFLGDVTFKPGRKKESVELAAKRGVEFSFGLNMELILFDLTNKLKTIEVMFRFKEKSFRDVFFKSYKKNPTTDDLVEQLRNTWIILGSGNMPEDPSAYVVAKISDYPRLCFTPQLDKGKVVKYRISFGQWSKWVPAKQYDIFGNLTIDEMFERMRK